MTKERIIHGAEYTAHIIADDSILVYKHMMFRNLEEVLAYVSDDSYCFEQDINAQYFDLTDGCPYYLQLLHEIPDNQEIFNLVYEITWELMHQHDVDQKERR